MNHRQWHQQEITTNPDYARASIEQGVAQAIADFIVDARIRAGLTQGQLAKLARTTQARISLVENGEGNPTLNSVDNIIAALRQRVPVDIEPVLRAELYRGLVLSPMATSPMMTAIAKASTSATMDENMVHFTRDVQQPARATPAVTLEVLSGLARAA